MSRPVRPVGEVVVSDRAAQDRAVLDALTTLHLAHMPFSRLTGDARVLETATRIYADVLRKRGVDFSDLPEAVGRIASRNGAFPSAAELADECDRVFHESSKTTAYEDEFGRTVIRRVRVPRPGP